MDSECIVKFIEKHLNLLEKERAVELERTSLVLSNCAPKLLEQRGLALLGLTVSSVGIGLGGKSLVELERSPALSVNRELPPHEFRPGDLARIEAHTSSTSTRVKHEKGKGHNHAAGSAIEGVVYKVSDVRIVIAVDSQEEKDPGIIPDPCRLLKLANDVVYERMKKTLLTLQDISTSDNNEQRAAVHKPLLEVLLGISKPSSVMKDFEVDFFDATLNQSQKDAVRFALGSQEVACIHGPPGTGKTHTLVEIIRQLLFVIQNDGKKVESGKRVLVCGASNLSVDNILERLLKLAPEAHPPIKCMRIGHPARVKGSEFVLEATLDAQTARSDQAQLIKDVKSELSNLLDSLSGAGRARKGPTPKGKERKKLWEEVRELRKEYRKRERDVVQVTIKNAQVVLATCHSSGSRLLNNMSFDVVIIDEATQALEAACWIPILKGKKLILAGDPMQLPPTVLSASSKSSSTKPIAVPPKDRKGNASTKDKEQKDETGDSADKIKSVDKENSVNQKTTSKLKEGKSSSLLVPPASLETTMFERLEAAFGNSIKRMLQVQYRMHKLICDFPNKALYDSKLLSDPSVENHLLKDLRNVETPADDDDALSMPVVFFDTSGLEYFESEGSTVDEGSRSNENEAMIVKMWAETLLDQGVLPSQIAILSPYQSQVSLLSVLINKSEDRENIEIGTIDGMQGREKEAVIISLVRSNEKREVGFLKDKRRLNVAMTRARRQLCVIGDSSTVRNGGPYLKNWMEWLEKNADLRYEDLQN